MPCGLSMGWEGWEGLEGVEGVEGVPGKLSGASLHN